MVRTSLTLVLSLLTPSKMAFQIPTADGKYHMLPSGELLVTNVTRIDAQKSYRCRTHHLLTQEAIVSANAGRIQLSGEFAGNISCHTQAKGKWKIPPSISSGHII